MAPQARGTEDNSTTVLHGPPRIVCGESEAEMRTSIIVTCVLALLLLSGTAVRAQYEQAWFNTHSGYWGVAVDMDSDGNVYTTGARLNLPENGFQQVQQHR